MSNFKQKLAYVLATAAALAFVSAPLTSTIAQAHHVKCYTSCKGKTHCKKCEKKKMMKKSVKTEKMKTEPKTESVKK